MEVSIAQTLFIVVLFVVGLLILLSLWLMASKANEADTADLEAPAVEGTARAGLHDYGSLLLKAGLDGLNSARAASSIPYAVVSFIGASVGALIMVYTDIRSRGSASKVELMGVLAVYSLVYLVTFSRIAGALPFR